MTTTEQIRSALRNHYVGRYAVLEEVTAGTGLTARERNDQRRSSGTRPVAGRRIDMLLVNRTQRIAIEIKVSRTDFLKDVKDPKKQDVWRQLVDRHYFAVPVGLVRASEVPENSGLIEVDGSKIKTSRIALKNADAPLPILPNSVVYTLLWRLSDAERRGRP